jgi:hypothetical protein
MRVERSLPRSVAAAGSVGILLALLAGGADLAAAAGNSGPSLLSRVQRAYDHVPGVELTAATRSGSAGAQSRRFLLALHAGTVTAEEFIGPGRHGVLLVGRRGGPTFVRGAGKACWRRLHHSNPNWVLKSKRGVVGRLQKSDPRTLLNAGYPFPDNGKALIRHNTPGVRQLVIETHSAFWYLAGAVVPRRIARKSFLTVTPNPRTYEIPSLDITAPEPAVRATLTVKPLPTRPSIQRPIPTC